MGACGSRCRRGYRRAAWAPLLQGVEIYHNRPIFYDLGNFVFNVPPQIWTIQEPMTWESVVASVEFQGKRLHSIRFRPIVLNLIGQGQPDAHDPYANNLFLDPRLAVASDGRESELYPSAGSGVLTAVRNDSRGEGRTAEINLKGGN